MLRKLLDFKFLMIVVFLISNQLFSIPISYEDFKNERYGKLTKRYDPYFRKYAKRYFGPIIDWKWFKSQAIAESNLNNEAESWVKAKGIMQIMPNTFASLKKKIPGLGSIKDVRWNIAAGIYYNKKMWNYWKADRPFEDRVAFMFASYNAGAGTIIRAQRVCKVKNLDENSWESIVEIARGVPKWRSEETIRYINRIFFLKNKILEK